LKCPSCQAECPEQAEACFTCGKALFALSQGTLLGGRYEIVRPVGQGGMSRVYQAHDRVLGEAVAIKVLRAELAWEPEMRQRFLHEIRLARRVSHANVCRIHEYGEDGPRRYISMELVEGVNLRDVLRHRGLSTEEAFDVVLQITDGLFAVHQHGIVHRDFKASNIMLARNGVAKLMDFGIAKHTGGETGNFTTPGQVLGTPEYMSPEHARGGKVDFRSDIYAVGCVVFEIFTGQAPFRGANAFATISKHFYEEPPLDGALAALIPEALVPVLRRALCKDPEARYASVPDMRAALTEAQAASVAPALDEPSDPNAIGSRRLQQLCEAMLARGLPHDAALESSAPIDTPSLPPPVAAAPEVLTPVRPAAAPPAYRRLPLLLGSTAAVLIAVVSSIRLWSDSREPAAPPMERPPVTTFAPARLAVATPPPVVSSAPPPSPAGSATVPRVARAEPSPSAPPPSLAAAPTVRASQQPVADAAATGTLRLLIVPWGEVMVDGMALGTVQLRDVPLAAGAHSVRVVHPDYQPLQRKVTIQPGTTVRLVLDLSEKGIRKTP
jgi:eukaryotic-like serine/threonine-protein kinase